MSGIIWRSFCAPQFLYSSLITLLEKTPTPLQIHNTWTFSRFSQGPSPFPGTLPSPTKTHLFSTRTLKSSGRLGVSARRLRGRALILQLRLLELVQARKRDVRGDVLQTFKQVRGKEMWELMCSTALDRYIYAEVKMYNPVRMDENIYTFRTLVPGLQYGTYLHLCAKANQRRKYQTSTINTMVAGKKVALPLEGIVPILLLTQLWLYVSRSMRIISTTI